MPCVSREADRGPAWWCLHGRPRESRIFCPLVGPVPLLYCFESHQSPRARPRRTIAAVPRNPVGQRGAGAPARFSAVAQRGMPVIAVGGRPVVASLCGYSAQRTPVPQGRPFTRRPRWNERRPAAMARRQIELRQRRRRGPLSHRRVGRTGADRRARNEDRGGTGRVRPPAPPDGGLAGCGGAGGGCWRASWAGRWW